VRNGRGANDQPHAFKLLGSYLAPWGITVGANYQALSGLPIDRLLTVPLSQGSRGVPMESRGTYRADFLNLLSLRADKRFTIHGSRRASFIAEVHNVTNSHAGQAAATTSYGSLTQGFARPGGVRRRAQDDLILRPRAGDRRAARAEDRVQVRLLERGFA